MERFGSLSKVFLSRGSVQLMVGFSPIFLALTLEFSRDLKRIEQLGKINEILGDFIGRWTSFDFIIFHLLCFSFFFLVCLFLLVIMELRTAGRRSFRKSLLLQIPVDEGLICLFLFYFMYFVFT